MKTKNTQLISLWVLLFALFPVQASNIGFLKYAVISDFNENDIQMLDESYHKVLYNNAAGDVLLWKNEKTKNGGEITVIKTYKKNKNSCKRLKFKNQSKHQSAINYYNFCLIEEKWLVVN